jgi:pimeloyl-ACP methyl ester carboxylesterase
MPVGFREFHPDKFFNYQLNRWYSLGFARLEDIETAAKNIRSFDDYIRVFMELGEQAESENRLGNAAFYYRAAEFLIKPSNPMKLTTYRKFIDLFYRAFGNEGIERHEVRYETGALPVMRLPARSRSKGTLLIHGGFDSFIEEYFCAWEYFADRGYDVVAFEGPGQGGALREHGLTFDHRWEKPVKAILDDLGLDDVAILGISMGGYWCMRAAAFEKRISRVIAFPPLYDWMESTVPIMQAVVNLMMKSDSLMRKSIALKLKSPLMSHVAEQTLFITGKQDLLDVVRWELGMNKKDLHSDLITQDVLLLAGAKDTFQPVTLYRKQMKALLNARSITGRVFTELDKAEHHCGVGNLQLALTVIADWMDRDNQTPAGISQA